MDPAAQRFGTRAVHAGQRPDPTTGAIMTPIFQTSTYVQDAVGSPRQGYDYARVSNPTRDALQANLAALENGRHGAAFSSGLAATEAIIKTVLDAGDHLICGADVYGGVDRMLRYVWGRFGVAFDFVDTTDLDQVRAAIRPETRLVHVETPSNPTMTITDIAGCAGIARAAGAVLSVDNTFATPFLQRPLDEGADIVMHSTTKFLNGHSDMIGGALLTNSDELAEGFRFQQRTTGAVPGPFDCWLVLRGTKTLHLRMPAHCANARRVVDLLRGHAEVESVRYPGLEDHPQHELAKRQMRDFGSMVSFDLGSEARANRFAASTRLFQLAESLGGVESLVSIPSSMTHASVPEEKKREIGLGPGLVRLSVGVEDGDDLVDDIEQALAALCAGGRMPETGDGGLT
ncbi:cystathionine gamma-synthase [Candidatus Palauibacter sp.]|uniref:cystathionine gamma-synthase n=1 Tax=Candidatus Palauibacter sp. TaxID=3101350 RepID=UPI003B01F28A